ncbi:uncharacterized protein CEXT_372531 [Caerostris extrusa]|nr:uncharacterized protein CEXT_372531 [Caerostris extrusa]
MEKDKEAVKKSCSFYATKKVEAAKTNFVNNNSRFPVRSDSARNKYSYISRNKNASVPTDKKLGLYGNKNKSYLKHTCDKCEIKARPHLVLNPGAGNSFTTTTQVQSGHDLNGNFSFNTYPTLYNFAPSVSEISTLNKVLSYQSNQHYELSIPESSKHKQRTTFFEQRTYNSKIAHSNNSYSASRFFPFPNPGIRWHCSNEFPQSFTV